MPIETRAAGALARPAARGGRRLALPVRKRGVSAQDRMFFTERLALLLETGTPLHSSLETLGGQIDVPAMRSVVGEMGQTVSGGHSFSQALARHPDAFPRSYVNLVAAGEGGGFLPTILQRLQQMDERRQELRSTLIAAFTYPAFLVVFSIAVVVFVLTVVFPKFGDLFALIRDQLPFTTRLLMTLSDVLRLYWLPILVVLGVAATLVWRWLKSPGGAEAADRLVLRLPVIREIVIQLQLVQVMQVMSLSLGNGVAMLDALRSCREIVRSASFRRLIANLEAGVSEGRGVASGFAASDLIPRLAKQLITTGEETGNLAMVMGRVSDFYEREWRKQLTSLAKLVEPAMLLVMGVVVGLFVSSLILPIFKLSSAVH